MSKQNILKEVEKREVEEINFSKAKSPLCCEVEINGGDIVKKKGKGFYKHHPSLFIDGDGGEFWEYYELEKRGLPSKNGKWVLIIEYQHEGDFLFYFCTVEGIDYSRQWEGESHFNSEITQINF